MQLTQPERKSDKEKLFARIRNEKVTLFIGSGFSLAAGAPSANANCRFVIHLQINIF